MMPVDGPRHYHLGPWVLGTDPTDGSPMRSPPAGTLGTIDLSPVAETGPGVGFFVTASPLGSDYRLYGDVLDGPMPPSQRNVWRSQVGMTQPPTETNILGVLNQTIGELADPDGVTHCKPRTPTHEGLIETHLGGHSLVSVEAFTGRGHRMWPVVQRVMQNEYRAIKLRNPLLAARWGESMRRKCGVEFEEIADRGDRPGKPETEYTEGYNKADSTTLGPDLTWAEVTNDSQVVNNTLRSSTINARCVARAEHDLSSGDHYTEIDVVALDYTSGVQRHVGPSVRFASAAETNYVVQVKANDTLGVHIKHLMRWNAGTFTSIATSAGTVTPPVTVKLQVSGSSLTFYIAGVLSISATDTNIPGNTRGGTSVRSDVAALAQGDNFRTEDLVLGHPAVRRMGGCFASRGVEIGHEGVRVY